MVTDLGTLKAANGGSTNQSLSTWEGLTANTAEYGQKETVYKFGKQVTKTYYDTSEYKTDALGAFDGNNGSGHYVDGSFRMNNNKAVIKVELGRRYIARFAAVNAAGASDYIFPDLVGTTVTATAGYTRSYTGESVAVSSLKKFGEDAALINRFRITYSLDGGSFYEADTLSNGVLPSRKDGTKITAVDGLQPGYDSVVRYGTQAAESANQIGIMNALYTKSSDDTPKNIILYDTNSRRWADWLYMSTSGDVYETAYNTVPASDATYNVREVPYMAWDSTANKKSTTIVGFANITLYASYKSATWEVDHSVDFNIQDAWVLMYSDLKTDGSTMAATPDTSKVNGTWTYVYGTAAPDPLIVGQTTAAHIYPLLLNDPVNNLVNGAGVSYTSVYVDVIRANGNISKRTVQAAAAKKTVDDKQYSVLDIDLASLAADTYTLVIHAYADTTQKEYTYTIAINVGQ